MEKSLKQLCKRNFLAIEKSYIEIKKIANMSSNDPNFNDDNTNTARMYMYYYLNPNNSYKFGLVYTVNFMWRLNLCWYIIKHNLDDHENKQKLIDFINSYCRSCKKWVDNPDFDITRNGTVDVYESPFYKGLIDEIIDKYLKVEEDGINK